MNFFNTSKCSMVKTVLLIGDCCFFFCLFVISSCDRFLLSFWTDILHDFLRSRIISYAVIHIVVCHLDQMLIAVCLLIIDIVTLDYMINIAISSVFSIEWLCWFLAIPTFLVMLQTSRCGQWGIISCCHQRTWNLWTTWPWFGHRFFCIQKSASVSYWLVNMTMIMSKNFPHINRFGPFWSLHHINNKFQHLHYFVCPTIVPQL